MPVAPNDHNKLLVVLNSWLHLPGEQQPQAFYHSDQLGQGCTLRMQHWVKQHATNKGTPFAGCQGAQPATKVGRVAISPELKQINAQSIKDASRAHNLMNNMIARSQQHTS